MKAKMTFKKQTKTRYQFKTMKSGFDTTTVDPTSTFTLASTHIFNK